MEVGWRLNGGTHFGAPLRVLHIPPLGSLDRVSQQQARYEGLEGTAHEEGVPYRLAVNVGEDLELVQTATVTEGGVALEINENKLILNDMTTLKLLSTSVYKDKIR